MYACFLLSEVEAEAAEEAEVEEAGKLVLQQMKHTFNLIYVVSLC